MESEEHLRKIKSVMSKKVLCVKESEKISDVARMMAKKSFSCVIVLHGKKPTGVVTERDIIKRLVAEKKDIKTTTIKEIMTTELITVTDNFDLVPVGQLMKKKKVRRFPVVNKDGNLVGLVTQTDIVEGILSLIKHLDWKLVTMRISIEEYIDKLKESKIIT